MIRSVFKEQQRGSDGYGANRNDAVNADHTVPGAWGGVCAQDGRRFKGIRAGDVAKGEASHRDQAFYNTDFGAVVV